MKPWRSNSGRATSLASTVSRLAPRLYTSEQRDAAMKIREAMATHQRSEDLINLGAYASGANPKLDAAIRLRPRLLDFLKQDAAQHAPFEQTMSQMRDLAKMTE